MEQNLQSDLSEAIQAVIRGIDELASKESALIAATVTLPLMSARIHVYGKKADGTQIGEYSKAYMKVRTGDYADATRFKKGVNKGKNKNAGTYTKGPNKGKPRPRYNRNSDRTIIFSLTRQMENDFSVIEEGNSVGLGFKNNFNFIKANALNKKHPGVYALSELEEYTILEALELRTHGLF